MKVERLKNLIPLWCEKTGQEYNEEQWKANSIDIARIENIMKKPRQRQDEAAKILLDIIEKGAKADPVQRAVRIADAIATVAGRPGNFKAKAIAERIGDVFYKRAGEEVFTEFDPIEIVRLKKEGKL